jgi:uncharacterized protein
MALTRRSTALFRGTRLLEGQIDEFLDLISEAALVFQAGIRIYLDEGINEEFEESVQDVMDIETRGDELRRTIETQLYTQTLIPDLRGDVLSLLEDLDDLMNVFEGNCFKFSIQAPDIPPEYNKDFLSLTETVVTCVDSVVLTARAFFRNIEAVRDHSHKVGYFETEADRISTRLKKRIFRSDLPLERKMHLNSFVDAIDGLANESEDIADRLGIYTIKRSV